MNQDVSSNPDKEKDDNPSQEKEEKQKKSVRRSKSFDIRSMFRAKTKAPDDDEVTTNLNELASTPPLNRNHSQPESRKLDTIRKSILERTQSVKKTTADFFGVNKEHEDENYQLWLEKRKRFYMKGGSKLKEKGDAVLQGTDTNDSQHASLFTSGDFEPAANFAMISAFTLPKPSVMQLAKKGIRSMQQEKSKKTSSVGYEPSPAIHMQVIKSAEPREVTLEQRFGFDDTAEDQTEANLRMQETVDASELLPNELIFSYELPKTPTKTWTIVDRKGRQRINSKLIESIYDNSDRRQYGMGILGKLLNRRFRKNLTKDQKDQLNSIYDSRPYFTYWIMSVQFVIMILALATYGFGPIGLQKVKISQPVLVNSLSIQEVSYFEPNNIWLGPRPADLIHLGAKFTPCMRKDKLIFDQIEMEREEEKETACCIRTDRSGCIQTKKDRCSPLLSTWKKWSVSDNITYKDQDNHLLVRTSGSVCGQDPRYCQDPKSWFPNIWPDDITKWPVCKQQKLGIKNGQLNQDPHMTCNLIGKPCCIGIHGECKITTKDYCDFVKGFFHEEATLCSQVSCMSDVCGMLQIKRDDNLLQIYRLFTSLFLHAGLIHIVVSFVFQYYVMRDFEKLFGSFRLLLLYMLSGMGGNLASAIFVPYRAEVGPGGSQFGVLAGLVAEQIHSWNLIEDPAKQMAKLMGIAGVLFVYGVFPWIDNYAHIFGFLIGFLLSLALLPFLTFTEKVRRKLKIILICICSAIVLVIFIVLLLFLYKFPIYECKYCSYLNCIPFTADWCSDHYIEVKRKDIL